MRTLQYEIHVRGLLSEMLLTAFPGLQATRGDRETVLTGTLPDQAALFGVLVQIETLGLELLDVHSAELREIGRSK